MRISHFFCPPFFLILYKLADNIISQFKTQSYDGTKITTFL
ncbi:Uncharacterized protein dnm_091470 [Desulfonema magnum]|uniref:Uncharacterized protein n=1 Tax=Desulfonema magnum TaxID=45655 RepID=A0A975BX98_9BACT|nr:Uncharacterized protein dnm_090020 [Desulfonema magnum]QTA93052.1 Uncharacterized protein dnm_091470 [Desulfonema magnum]